MGQYQQWLHFQDVDRHLRAELESLENELLLLQDRTRIPAEAAPQAENSILRTLGEQLSRQKETQEQASTGASRVTNGAGAQEGETISAALLHWGGLPDFGTHSIEDPFPTQTYFPKIHPEPGLLPEDMVAFFEQHGNTDPWLQSPWWLRGDAVLADDEQAQFTHPLDPETMRTNERIQRWIKRWKRATAASGRAEEGRHE